VTESRGEKTELTGGGGSEKQRAEERESGCRESDENGVAEKLNGASVLSLKRRRLASARTRPDPTKTVPDFFFFGAENGYAGGTHAAVPRQYPYPRGTAGFLPYRCFLGSTAKKRSVTKSRKERSILESIY
jgi:hypothetical protein